MSQILGNPKNALMRLTSLIMRWLEENRDNVKGLLPRVIRNAGFEHVKETAKFMTMFGTISLYRAQKPEQPGRTFERQRQRIAHKLGNPRIQRITFHTLRHWKATTEYQKTKDILHVMRLLGHKSIKNTLLYTQLISPGKDEYSSKVARTVEEARMLIEAGFEYVCEVEDAKLFRKRK